MESLVESFKSYYRANNIITSPYITKDLTYNTVIHLQTLHIRIHNI